MALEITKEKKPEPFICDRYLYLNADKSKVLEEGDPGCRFVFSGPGSTVSTEDVKKYGLDKAAPPVVASEKEPEKPKEKKPEGPKAKVVEPAPAKPTEPPVGEDDKLPTDFPGFVALEKVGIHTYEQVEKAIADDVKISGIGDPTKLKIIEALTACGQDEK